MSSSSATANFQALARTHWRHEGVTYYVRPPASARDVLFADVFICSHLQESPSAHHIAMLAEWCALHVDNATSDDIDELGLSAMLRLKGIIIDSAAMPARTLDAVYRYFHVLYSGGCECPRCKGDERYDKLTDAQKAKVDATCRLNGVTSTDKVLADLAYTFEGSDPLDMPWWLYQLHTRRMAGISRGQAERLEQERAGREAQAKLEAKGLWKHSSAGPKSNLAKARR
jgi:hypothetical protein